jgi:hypothetical protein
VNALLRIAQVRPSLLKGDFRGLLSFFSRPLIRGGYILASLRNTWKREFFVEEKLTSKFLSIFSEKVFDMDFLQKHFYGVFELPLDLPRNAQKRT